MEIVSGNPSVLNTSGVAVLKFTASWCGPCQKYKPIIETLDTEFETVKFYEIDTDQNLQLARQYNCKGVPLLVFLKDGQEVNRVSGLTLTKPLRNILNELTKDSHEEK